MRACKPLPYGQLTTALVPTVPSPCFLRQSATAAKVRETFLCLVCQSKHSQHFRADDVGVALIINGCGCGFVCMRAHKNTIQTSNKNFNLKYFRCRDGKRTETRIGKEGSRITHSCIPLYTVYLQHILYLTVVECRNG